MRKIITYGGYFEEFIRTLNPQELRKVDYLVSLLATEDRIPSKFVKSIRDGLYELRIKAGANIYRVFFIFDGGNIVVLFNCFQKKTVITRLRTYLDLYHMSLGPALMKSPYPEWLS